MKYFLLWTAVMKPIFQSPNDTASSTASFEGEFNILKNSILKGHNPPMRLDKFVSVHLKSLQGDAKIKAADLMTTEILRSPVEERITELEEEEDWRGKNTKSKIDRSSSDLRNSLTDDVSAFISARIENGEKSHMTEHKKPPKKRTYLNPFPDIRRILDNPALGSTIGILRNGNCIGTLKVNNEVYMLINTCPFDSVLQSIASLYVDNDSYCKLLNSLSSPFINFMKYFVEHGPKKITYLKRAELLLGMYTSSEPKPPLGIRKTNAEDYVGNTLQKLLFNIPSAIDTFNCEDPGCQNNKERLSVFWAIDTNVIKENVKNFEDAMKCGAEAAQKHCSLGNHIRVTNRVLGHHLIVEPRVGLPGAASYSLTDFPVQVTIQEINFVLGAIIMHVRGGHYVSYCHHKNNVWELYDDLLTSVQRVNPHSVTGLTEVVIYIRV